MLVRVKIAPTYKYMFNHFLYHFLSDVRLFNRPVHDQYYWTWFVDINGGCPNSEKLIACNLMDLNETLIP
jgi:hypothetical protein